MLDHDDLMKLELLRPLMRSTGPVKRYLTESLFKEFSYGSKSSIEPIFTVKEQDEDDLLSLQRLYLECADPTEALFAQIVFGSYAHWEKILDNKKLIVEVEKWRYLLERKLRSIGIRTMLDRALDGKDRNAAKWLAEGGWLEPKRGRPTRKESEAREKMQQGVQEEVEADLARLRAVE